MADVFISYSRDDRSRVRAIADALKAEGLSVWWDPEILPGTTFDEIIDRELTSALCVIVAWSKTSVQSRWVREEAAEALDREVLLPIWIDQVPLPRGFKLVQTEDMIGWAGDREANCWQRIMLQARALTGKSETVSGAVETTEAKNQPSMPISQALAPPAPVTAAVSTAGVAPVRDVSHSATFALTVLSALVLAATWGFGHVQNGGVLSATLALAAMTYLLFRFAESDLSPGMKAIASRWFLPVEGKVQIKSIEAFNNMFEAVFGQKHLSWKCFLRSAVASTISLAAILAIFDMASSADFFKHLVGEHANWAWRIAIVLVAANILGDFLSLWETRWFLRFAVRRPVWLVPIIFLDAVFSAVIFSVTLIVGAFAVAALMGDVQVPISVPVNDREMPLLASIATAYVTSVWLWLALLFGPIARFLVWSRRSGLTTAGRWLDAKNQPFTALGYISAGIILLIGIAVWAVGKSWST